MSVGSELGARVRSVAEVTDRIKRLLEGDLELADLWVQGEVSNFHPAASGHWYWTLKDGDAALRCVMWRQRAASQTFQPLDGQAVIVHGSVSVYSAQGQVQLYADYCEAVGHGELFLAFERLKAQLEAEGLFAPERKRRLPSFPRRIGVVTSPDAAALRDVGQVLARRWPSAELLVAPTLVQGDGAPPQIVRALAAAARAGVEVILLVRGGGSIEDLWAFNDESVARAVAASPIPVVSGVGHETDTTIVDFVADVRAPTPSAAAEVCVPDGRELALSVDQVRERLARRWREQLRARETSVGQARRRLGLLSPRKLASTLQTGVADRRHRLDRALSSRVRLARSDLSGLERRLTALDPAATLGRGYAQVTRRADGRPVLAVADAPPGTTLAVHVRDGRFDAVVEGQGRLFGSEGKADEPTRE